jgi:hypothetical protein
MNTIEDRLRSAIQETASEVTPGSLPPLELPARARRTHPTQPGRPGRRSWSRLAGWLAPLAAAAAVLAVLAGSLAVTRGLSHRHPAARPNALSKAPAVDGGAIPRYYVTLQPGPLSEGSTRAVVRATATGAALAAVRPPRSYSILTWVSAAADDRSFVLSAQPKTKASYAATAFFLLRLDPAAGTAKLTRLAIPGVPASWQVTGLALSPDGSKLAVALQGTTTKTAAIQVVDLSTGARREWTSVSGLVTTDELGANPLSWTADGRTLAFDYEPRARLNVEVRLLDTAARSSSLESARAAVTFVKWPGGSVAGAALITPDGTRIVAAAVLSSAKLEFHAYSVRTGKLVAVLGRLRYHRGAITGWPDVYWTDASGSALIVKVTRPGARAPGNGGLTSVALGVLTGTAFTPLRGAPAGSMPAW